MLFNPDSLKRFFAKKFFFLAFFILIATILNSSASLAANNPPAIANLSVSQVVGSATVNGMSASDAAVISNVSYQVDGTTGTWTDASLSNATTPGQIDNTLAHGNGIGIGPDYAVYAIALQADNKILIGGNFSNYNGVARNEIARLNTDGSIDTSFVPGTSKRDQVIYSIVPLSGGKILIGGAYLDNNGQTKRVSRLNSDGSFDNTFNPGGVTANDYVKAMAVQSDNKIIIVGAFTSYNGTARNHIARLNADGTLDTSFDPGTGANAIINAVAIQSDGKIIIGGGFSNYNGNGAGYIARLNSDGSFDNTFTAGAGADGDINSVVIQTDGQILIGGSFTSYDSNSISGVARLNTDGTWDSTLSGLVSGGPVFSIAVQADGYILIGGLFDQYNGALRSCITRLHADGSLDSSDFLPGSGFNDLVSAIVIQPDGKQLIGGSFNSYGGTVRKNLIRLTGSTAMMDATFNPFSEGLNGYVKAIVPLSDGKILIAGSFTVYGLMPRSRIARLNSDGSLDTGFNPGYGADGDIEAMAVQPDGKIIITGSFSNYNSTSRRGIARLNTNGSLDTTFVVGNGLDDLGDRILIQPDGKILIGGAFTTYNSTTSNCLVRLNTNGSLDGAFTSGLDSNTGCVANSISLQADGKIIVGGSFGYYEGNTINNIVRINSDGSYDSGFNVGVGTNSTVLASAVRSDDRIVIAGWFTTYDGDTANRVAVLNTDGSLYSSFNATWDMDEIFAIAIQPDNKIVVAGDWSNALTSFQKRIMRLNADGSIDSDFNVGVGGNDYFKAVALQTDGKILVGGAFTAYNFTPANYLARLSQANDANFSATFSTSALAEGQHTVYIRTTDADGNNNDGSYSSINFTITLYPPTFSTISQTQTASNISFNGLAFSKLGSISSVGYQVDNTSGSWTSSALSSPYTSGQLDSSLAHGSGSGIGANKAVRATLIQPDGKIIIAGDITLYNGVIRNFIARLNSDGSIDNSFNPDIEGTSISAIALTASGKILAVGSITNRIIQLNNDGSVDTNFNPGSGADGGILSIALQPDNKIIIGGLFTTYNGTSISRIARLNSDGTLDSSFNPGVGPDDDVNAIVVQGDGKIIIGGNFLNYDNIAKNRLVRLNSDGSIDNGFTIGTGPSSGIEAIKILGDNKIYIAGSFATYNGTNRRRIARLNADGTLDTSFVSSTGASSLVYAVYVQSDDKVIIGGDFGTYNGTARNRLARLNSDGSLDTSFTVGTGASGTVYSITLDSNSKLLVGGNFITYNTVTKNRVMRVNTDGSLDSSFNPVSEGADNVIRAIAIQADGKLVVGGNFNVYSGASRNRIARLNADGTLDSSFNPGTGASAIIYSLYIQPDGKILVGGSFTSYNGVSAKNRIIRLNSDGSLDTGFTGTGSAGPVYAITMDSDNKILIGGTFTSYNGTSISRIARLNSDGTLDTGFNVGTGFDSTVYGIAVQSNGKIVVDGTFSTYNGTARVGVARLNSDGSLDTGFVPGSGPDDSIECLAMQTDGKILMGGTFEHYNNVPAVDIVRLNTDGSLDTDFVPDIGGNTNIYSILVQLDGKVIIGGDFVTSDSYPRSGLARLNSDGSLDTSFAVGTGINTESGATSDAVYSLTLDSDGKLIIGGQFSSYNSSPLNFLAKLSTTNSSVFSSTVPTSGLSVGNHTIYIKATDSLNNTNAAANYATANFTINDTTNPIITLIGSSSVDVMQNSLYSDAGATATDDVDGNLTSGIVVNNPVNTAVVGTYTVTYNVVDAAGNHATQVSRIVNVLNGSVPLITLRGLSNITIDQGSAYVDLGATAADDIDGNITNNIIINNSLNTSIVGTYTITYNVSNSAGNHAAQVTRTIIVRAPAAATTSGTIPVVFSSTSSPVCSNVAYGDYAAPCFNGYQYRPIISSSPAGCRLTTSQQEGVRRSCSAINNSSSSNSSNIVSDQNATSTSYFISQEKSLVTTINKTLTNRLSGRILLQVEDKGQAWYVNPLNGLKYSLGAPSDAFSLMRELALGVSNKTFDSFKNNIAPARLSGRILLNVEDSGKAYYVNPINFRLYYLGRPSDAYNLMRTLGLGITNSDLRKIGVGEIK